MLTTFCRKFRKFLFLHLGQFSRNCRRIGEIVPGIVPTLFGALGSPENAGGKGPGFDSGRGVLILMMGMMRMGRITRMMKMIKDEDDKG